MGVVISRLKLLAALLYRALFVSEVQENTPAVV